jgi:nucleoside-diphosphate-sugar epimerase
VEKLKAAIGFAPATPLDEIIQDTIKALRSLV